MNKLILILASILLSPLTNANQFNVIVDPGHGGKEHGAINGKYREATIALQVAKKLNKMLNAESNIKSFLTRSTDKTLSLPQRVHIAHQKKADLFVSIHINSSTNHRARGGEVYIRNELIADDEKLFLAQFENGSQNTSDVVHKSQFVGKAKSNEVIGILENMNETYNLKLASLIAKDILKDWGGTKRTYHNRIHQAPFYVVKHTQMPSILVELGFISNNTEARKLVNASYQNKLAKGILKGVKNYFARLSVNQSTGLNSRK